MKWFKHFHNADSSHKLALLMENHGKSAYAEYWLLLELLCEKYKGDEEQIEVTEGELCRKLRRPFPKKMKTFLKALQNLSILDYKENEKTFKFETRILWELKQKDFARARRESKPEAIKSPPREKREEKREKNNTPKPPKGGITLDQSCEIIVDVWNQTAEVVKLSKITLPLAEKRKANLKKAIKQMPDLFDWGKAISIIAEKPFHLGHNERGWKANFDWLIAPTKMNYLKLAEEAKAQEAND
jgi:hypothetical protein